MPSVALPRATTAFVESGRNFLEAKEPGKVGVQLLRLSFFRPGFLKAHEPGKVGVHLLIDHCRSFAWPLSLTQFTGLCLDRFLDLSVGISAFTTLR